MFFNVGEGGLDLSHDNFVTRYECTFLKTEMIELRYFARYMYLVLFRR